MSLVCRLVGGLWGRLIRWSWGWLVRWGWCRLIRWFWCWLIGWSWLVRWGWLVFWGFWVLSFTFISNFGDISTISIYGVGYFLESAVGKSNIIRTNSALAISAFRLSVIVTGIIIFDCPII